MVREQIDQMLVLVSEVLLLESSNGIYLIKVDPVQLELRSLLEAVEARL